MTEPSRRTVLAGLGTTTLAAIAGCTGRLSGDSDEPTEETGWQDDLSLPDSLVTALGYVYSHDDGDSPFVTIFDMDGWSSAGSLGPLDSLAMVDPEWNLLFGPASELPEWTPVAVFTGEFEPAGGTERGEFTLQEVDVEDERLGLIPDEAFPDDEGVVATDGEVAVVGSRDQVTTTLDTHADGEEPYLAGDEATRRLVGELGTGEQTILATDSEPLLEEMREDDVEIGALPEPVGLRFEQSQDVAEVAVAAGTTDEAVVDELELLAAEFYGLDAEFEHRSTDRFVIVEGAEALDRPSESALRVEMHVSFDAYDETAGEVLFHVQTGETVPVADLTIEIADERYERDWARGAEELDDGSRIAIDADAIEPGDRLTVSREYEDGTASSTRTALSGLPFELDYDPDALTATLQYTEGPPLPAERTELRVVEGYGDLPMGVHDDDPEEGRVVSLSDDLAQGESRTVEDVEPGHLLAVVYERTDGETLALTQRVARPPGQFSTGVEDGTLLVTRGGSGPETLSADRYEVRIDGEPTDRQWTDRGGSIEPGETLEAGEVGAGERVTVLWVGERTEHELHSTVVPPDIRLVATYDEDEDGVRLVHDGGESVDADLLTVTFGLEGFDERTISWDGDTVSTGDELLVEPDDASFLIIQVRDELAFEPVLVPDLREDGEMVLEPRELVSPGEESPSDG